MYLDISALFGKMGKKLMRASARLNISNEFANLAFVRHLINFYTFYCTIGEYSRPSMYNLMKLKSKLPKLKDIKMYFKENDIQSLNKFVSLFILHQSIEFYRNC